METIAEIALGATESVGEKEPTLLEALVERQSKIVSYLNELNITVTGIRSTLFGEHDPPVEASDKPEEVMSVTGNLVRLTTEIEQQIKRLQAQISDLKRL